MFRLIRFAATSGSLLLLLAPSPAAAQPVAATFADLRVAPGSSVVVTDREGHETAGRVASLSGATLSLIIEGREQAFAEADTFRISRDGDSLKNGAVWGLGVGAVMGILAVNTCEPNCRGGAGAGGAVAMLDGGGLALGVLIDRLVSGHAPLFQSPGGLEQRVAAVPIAARRGAGFGVRIRF